MSTDPNPAPNRCGWVADASVPGGQFFLPECMGGAVAGPEGCVCADYSPSAAERIRQLREENQALLDRLEAKDSENRALRSERVRIWNRYRGASREVARLRRQIETGEEPLPLPLIPTPRSKP